MQRKGFNIMLRPYLKLTRITIYLCFFLPLIVVLCSPFLDNSIIIAKKWIPIFGCMSLVSFLCCIAISRLFHWLEPSFHKLSEEQVKFISNLSDRWISWAIIASAAGSLALELAIIRWQGTVWEIFAFYKNFGLLACFAGLGIGYALAKRDHIPLIFTLPLLALQIMVLIGMRHGMPSDWLTSLMAIPIAEQLNMGFNSSTNTPHLISVYSFLSVVMLLTALAFIPVGQICGRWMERTHSLQSYSLNLMGSILGTLLMMALSLAWTPPIIWLIPCFAILIILQAFDSRVILTGILAGLLAITVLAWPVSFLYEQIYSPYQLLERGKGEYGLTLLRAAGHYYQRIHDLSVRAVAAYPNRQAAQDYYELPYRIHPRSQRVAIVGSGTGNDVAAALRCGIPQVDAIEIDPAILAIGTTYHPERPYHNSRVTCIVDDARTFLRSTDQSYDMVVYGLLDSHTLLSQSSNIRLDSFVYTVEGIRDAKNRLVEDGVISLSFCMISPQLGRKIYLMMEKAFDYPPICIRANYDKSVIFLQSKNGKLNIDTDLLKRTGFCDVTSEYANPQLVADISTDDWPFFYMPQRVYPVSYMWMMALILVISLILFWSFISERPQWNHASFFFMGAGFMLIETKAITELGLMFGNTWQVIGIVILAVLAMAYLANLAVMKFNFHRVTIALLLLLVSLGVGIFVAKTGGMPATSWGSLAAIVILTIPMFFSGIAFSSLLSDTGNISDALAMNLLGAMCGGLLEYNSMYFGFQFLYWLAMGLYGLAMLSHCFFKRPL